MKLSLKLKQISTREQLLTKTKQTFPLEFSFFSHFEIQHSKTEMGKNQDEVNVTMERYIGELLDQIAGDAKAGTHIVLDSIVFVDKSEFHIVIKYTNKHDQPLQRTDEFKLMPNVIEEDFDPELLKAHLLDAFSKKSD